MQSVNNYFLSAILAELMRRLSVRGVFISCDYLTSARYYHNGVYDLNARLLEGNAIVVLVNSRTGYRRIRILWVESKASPMQSC